MSHSNSGVWGHSSSIGANAYFIFAVSDDIAVNKAFMGWAAANSIGLKPLLGSYKGKTEHSYIANHDNLGTIARCGWLKDQESVLILGPCNARDQRPAHLYFPKTGNQVQLGVLQSVDRDTALASDGWSYDPSTKTYYICIDPNAVRLCPHGLAAAIAVHSEQHEKPMGENQGTEELIKTYLLARRSI